MASQPPSTSTCGENSARRKIRLQRAGKRRRKGAFHRRIAQQERRTARDGVAHMKARVHHGDAVQAHAAAAFELDGERRALPRARPAERRLVQAHGKIHRQHAADEQKRRDVEIQREVMYFDAARHAVIQRREHHAAQKRVQRRIPRQRAQKAPRARRTERRQHDQARAGEFQAPHGPARQRRQQQQQRAAPRQKPAQRGAPAPVGKACKPRRAPQQ